MEELGGAGYRALKLRSWLPPAYPFLCLVLRFGGMGGGYCRIAPKEASRRQIRTGNLNPQAWTFLRLYPLAAAIPDLI